MKGYGDYLLAIAGQNIGKKVYILFPTGGLQSVTLREVETEGRVLIVSDQESKDGSGVGYHVNADLVTCIRFLD